MQTANDFSTGRASGGIKFAYPWHANAVVTIAPYLGAYADYYFNNSNSVPLLLPAQFVQGWSGRVTAGLALQHQRRRQAERRRGTGRARRRLCHLVSTRPRRRAVLVLKSGRSACE